MLRWMLIGLVVWAAATVILRVTDLFALPPGLSERLLVLAALAVPALVGVVVGVLSFVPHEDRMAAALGIVAPGMAADAFVTIHYAQVFPLADPQSASAFGALMLWCYAVALFAAAALSRRAPRT